MNEDIMLLSNKLVYQDRLKVGSDFVATQRLRLPKPGALEELGAQSWIRDLLEPE
jgi:DNA replication ATP-dependent helicase Dna2